MTSPIYDRSVRTVKRRFAATGLLSLMLSVPAVWADSGYAEADVIAVSPRYETVTYSEPREECQLERKQGESEEAWWIRNRRTDYMFRLR